MISNDTQLVHSGCSPGIFTDLYGVDKILCNGDLVECGRGTNHSDAGNGLLCERLSPQTLQTKIIRLKGGNRSRDKLRFGILRLHVPFVLLHEEKDPEVPVDHTDIGFSVRVRPANEEGNIFSLTNVTIIGCIVLEHGKEIGRKIQGGPRMLFRDPR